MENSSIMETDGLTDRQTDTSKDMPLEGGQQ